jgi:hypothetical protein
MSLEHEMMHMQDHREPTKIKARPQVPSSSNTPGKRSGSLKARTWIKSIN